MRVLGKNVETMLDGCAGTNHVTEELVVGMVNHAKSLGLGTGDPTHSLSVGSTQRSDRNQGQTARRQGSGLGHRGPGDLY